MAIQYYMRAYNTALSTFVDWIVNDAPDTTGTFSGYSTGNLSNIIVNRVVSSKIDNFLKPSQSLGGADGNYFHVNSYDWLKATAPIGVPTTLTGLAVERGITLLTTVTSASNATPIIVTTAAPHGLATGALVTIIGVQGNVAANGTFPITNNGSNSFILNGSHSSGAYTSGGTIYTPTDFSTLTWDEVNATWRFALNTKGNGTTLGLSQELRVLNSKVDGYIALGADPADTGIIRIPNNEFVFSEPNPTGVDISVIGVDTSNRIRIGSTVSDAAFVTGNLRVGSNAPTTTDGFIKDGGTPADTTTASFIRVSNNTNIITIRNAANSANIIALSSTSANRIVLGDAVNAGTVYNTATGGLHAFQINSTSTIELGDVFARFTAGVVAPTVMQVTAGAGQTGQTLTLQAQNGGTGATTGGIAQVMSGTGSAFSGTVDLSTGGVVKVRVFPTVAPAAANNNSIQLFENKVRFDTAQGLPRIMQDDVVTSSTNGQAMTIQAQTATGSSSTGGNLLLTSGAGTTSAGNVIITTGGTQQIIVSPTQTTILGNLLVNGTTTSIASTVVEIADRVVHFNSSANQFPGTTTPAPTQITGFSVDRGSTNTTTKRDYYGLFWVEADNYWKFAVNTDGYALEQVLSTNLPAMAQYIMVQPSATLTAAAVPTVGGFRTLNNTVALSSRNAASTQDLILVSTDATNHLIWGAGTQNAGHVFNTTTSTIYDYQVNSVSTYTLTPISNGTTTLQATAGVTALIYTQTATGGATGANTTMSAQNAATTGGNLIHSSGTGTTAGNVQLQTGAVDKVVVHPTFTSFHGTAGAEAVRITPVSTGTTQVTFATGVTTVSMNQTATAGTTGAPWTIQAQAGASGTGGDISLIAGNATATGGNAVITSGTGATAGNVQLQTGAVDRLVVHPTFAEFRDTAEAYRITPVSASTTTLQAASTVLAVIYKHADLTTNGATGGPTTIQAQNETGTTSTGGALNLVSGTGSTVDGNVVIKTGTTTRITVSPTTTTFADTAATAITVTPASSGSTLITMASTVTGFTLGHTASTTASGAFWQISSQSTSFETGTGGTLSLVAGSATGVAGTGGSIDVRAGTGGTANGTINFRLGGTTFAQWRSLSASTATLQWVSGQTPTITQSSIGTNGITAATMNIAAQDATGTTTVGGALNLSSGTGTTNGAVALQVAGVTTASTVTNKFVYNKGQRRNITAISSAGGTYTVLASDDFVAITTLAVSFTINLPATPTLGDTYQIKDTTGNASPTVVVTVSGNGANIDGLSSITITSGFTSVTVTYTGAQWSLS